MLLETLFALDMAQPAVDIEPLHFTIIFTFAYSSYGQFLHIFTVPGCFDGFLYPHQVTLEAMGVFLVRSPDRFVRSRPGGARCQGVVLHLGCTHRRVCSTFWSPHATNGALAKLEGFL